MRRGRSARADAEVSSTSRRKERFGDDVEANSEAHDERENGYSKSARGAEEITESG